jgi:hypothetical protein
MSSMAADPERRTASACTLRPRPTDVVAKFRELSGDAAATPGRVLARHALDQFDDLRRERRAAVRP